jgi:hypothetical protein
MAVTLGASAAVEARSQPGTWCFDPRKRAGAASESLGLVVVKIRWDHHPANTAGRSATLGQVGAGIANVADTVFVDVKLIWVGYVRAVVSRAAAAARSSSVLIGIDTGIAGVSAAVTIQIQLIGIKRRRTYVTDIPEAIAIEVPMFWANFGTGGSLIPRSR